MVNKEGTVEEKVRERETERQRDRDRDRDRETQRQRQREIAWCKTVSFRETFSFR